MRGSEQLGQIIDAGDDEYFPKIGLKRQDYTRKFGEANISRHLPIALVAR